MAAARGLLRRRTGGRALQRRQEYGTLCNQWLFAALLLLSALDACGAVPTEPKSLRSQRRVIVKLQSGERLVLSAAEAAAEAAAGAAAAAGANAPTPPPAKYGEHAMHALSVTPALQQTLDALNARPGGTTRRCLNLHLHARAVAGCLVCLCRQCSSRLLLPLLMLLACAPLQI